MRTRRLRPAVLGVVLTALALVVPAGTAQAAPVPAPWLQTGYNAANSQYNATETTVGADNVTSLRSQYTIKAPPQDCRSCGPYGLVSTPVISQGRLYALISDDLTAFDLSSGRRLWHTPLFSDYLYLRLAVVHGYVVVGSTQEANDPLDSVDVYDADSGALIRSLGSPDSDGLQGVEVFGKYIIAQFGCRVECEGFTGRTVAYRTSNLSVAWMTPTPRATHNVGVGTSVVDGQTFEVAQTASGYQLHSFLAYNGAAKWTRDGFFGVLGGDTDAASANNLIALDHSGVADLNPRTGATRFRLPLISVNAPGSPNGQNLAVDATRIYATCATDGTQVCAFSTSDGHLLWRRSNPSGASGYSSITAANGVVYLESGRVLSARSGTVITTLSSHPALVGSGRVGAFTGEYDDSFTILAPAAS